MSAELACDVASFLQPIISSASVSYKQVCDFHNVT